MRQCCFTPDRAVEKWQLQKCTGTAGSCHPGASANSQLMPDFRGSLFTRKPAEREHMQVTGDPTSCRVTLIDSKLMQPDGHMRMTTTPWKGDRFRDSP